MNEELHQARFRNMKDEPQEMIFWLVLLCRSFALRLWFPTIPALKLSILSRSVQDPRTAWVGSCFKPHLARRLGVWSAFFAISDVP